MADDKRDTRIGYGPPESAANKEFLDETAVTLPPFIEIELSYERGFVGMEMDTWRALEIWTRNRIYIVDWSMRCMEVVDRKTAESDPNHPLLGAYLAGGQRKTADAMEMTYPVPRPDTEAVFEYRKPRKGYVSTSTVTRVVLRLRVLTMPHEHVRPTWESLTGSVPPPSGEMSRRKKKRR